jgi:hypothetical protein
MTLRLPKVLHILKYILLLLATCYSWSVQAAPSENIQPTNWSTYRSEKWGFSIQYPSSWKMVEDATGKSGARFMVAFSAPRSEGLMTAYVVAETCGNNSYGYENDAVSPTRYIRKICRDDLRMSLVYVDELSPQKSNSRSSEAVLNRIAQSLKLNPEERPVALKDKDIACRVDNDCMVIRNGTQYDALNFSAWQREIAKAQEQNRQEASQKMQQESAQEESLADDETLDDNEEAKLCDLNTESKCISRRCHFTISGKKDFLEHYNCAVSSQ